MKLFVHRLFSIHFIATILLFLFLSQLVYFEGYGVSTLKVLFMCFLPIIFLTKVPLINKCVFWGIIYITSICIVVMAHNYVRFSTVGFLALHVLLAVVFYNLIHANAFNLEYFIKVLKYIILAYAICLVAQQLFILVGIRFMPFINLCNQPFLAIDKLPSFSIEPSHSARILTATMFGYLKCNEFLQGASVTAKQLFSCRHKWVTIGFLWTMITMGSGTAFVGLGILSLYFFNKRNIWYMLPLFSMLFIVLSFVEFKQLDRAVNLFEASLTGDIQVMKEAEGSGASRIIPIVNTFSSLDFSSSETWLGVGTTTLEYNQTGWARDDVKIGAIEQYGILTYFISLVFIFSCFIRKILSIETIIFIILLGCSLANVYYIWGVLMLFSVVKYFDKKYKIRHE